MTKPEKPSRMRVRSVALTVAGFMCMGIGLLVGLETLAGMVRMQHQGDAVGSPFISIVFAKDSALFLKYSVGLMLVGVLITAAGYVISIINKRHN